MEFLEFAREIDKNDDEVFTFHPIGKVEPLYQTRITIDWLNEDLEGNGLVIRTDCDCKDHAIRKRQCKHIKECIKVLEKRGIKLRLPKDLKRYFCPVCKIGIDSVDYNLDCGYCGHEIKEPKKNES